MPNPLTPALPSVPLSGAPVLASLDFDDLADRAADGQGPRNMEAEPSHAGFQRRGGPCIEIHPRLDGKLSWSVMK